MSSRLAFVRRLLGLGAVAPAGVIVTLAAAAQSRPAAMVALVGATLAGAWLWWLVGRQVGAIGYRERADDLVVTRGVLFRELVIVPYGRMQLVDVRAGPLARRYGMATLQLHTAAATTDASIPGLPVAEASRLRDRLAAMGEARTAGL